MSKKEFLKGKCHQLLFGWECCGCWYKFAHFIELFIMDAFVDLFITLCIVINTFFMAMEQEGMDEHMTTTLKYGNYVSSAAPIPLFHCLCAVKAWFHVQLLHAT